jgi:predicted nuclease of restriction endonuclease-like (RecB) superfamily
LTWTHYKALFRVENDDARDSYAVEARSLLRWESEFLGVVRF